MVYPSSMSCVKAMLRKLMPTISISFLTFYSAVAYKGRRSFLPNFRFNFWRWRVEQWRQLEVSPLIGISFDLQWGNTHISRTLLNPTFFLISTWSVSLGVPFVRRVPQHSTLTVHVISVWLLQWVLLFRYGFCGYPVASFASVRSSLIHLTQHVIVEDW
jgi:hypothetical protein